MDIDKTKCVGCGNCHIICTMGVISLDEEGKSVVNQDECVECSTCYRVLRSENYPPWFVLAITVTITFFIFRSPFVFENAYSRLAFS
jgi:ferredoxin